jgi:hypothetical protein
MADISDNGSFNAALVNNSSQNFGPTAIANQQNTNANTQVQQQQATQMAMANKLMASRMPLILAGLHDESVGAGDQTGVGGGGGGGNGAGGAQAADLAGVTNNSGTPGQNSPGQNGPGTDIASQDKSSVDPNQNFYQPDKIDAALRNQYFVPQFTPQEMAALRKAYLVDPNDQYGMGPKRVMAMHDMRIAQATQQNQLDSRDDFDKLSAVTDAPDGRAMDVLEASHPETVAAIRRQFAKDPNEDMDEDAAARMFASHVAGAVHQYTGRKAVKDDAGVYRDEDTGIPIPGVEKVGLSSAQYIKLAQDAITPSVDMPDGNGGTIKVAPWKAAQMMGAKNINGPGDWIMVQASQRGLPGASSTLSPNSAQKQEAHTVAQAALDKAQSNHASAPDTNASGTPKSVNGTGTARNAQGNVNLPLTTALQDKDFDYKPLNPDGSPYQPQIGHTPPPSVIDDMKKQTDARNQLRQTSNQGVGAAQAALTMYKAAQDVLAKGNYNGGAWNAELAKYGKWLPAGWQDHMTGDYQEVAKYLGQAALQAGKGIFAKMTQKEAEWMKNELNPSPGMDPTAMRDMISKGAKVAQYSLDSAQRVPAYLNSGKEANSFPTWNQRHFPMETETQVTPTKPNSGVAPAPKYSDSQVSAYMKKHGLTDEQATRKALGLQ